VPNWMICPSSSNSSIGSQQQHQLQQQETRLSTDLNGWEHPPIEVDADCPPPLAHSSCSQLADGNIPTPFSAVPNERHIRFSTEYSDSGEARGNILRRSVEQKWMERKMSEVHDLMVAHRSVRSYFANQMGISQKTVPGSDRAAMFVQTRYYLAMCAILIAIDFFQHCVYMNISLTNLLAEPPKPRPLWGKYLELAFCLVHAAEVAFRVFALRWSFVFGKKCSWNVFESIMVMVSAMAAIIKPQLAAVRLLRFIRVLRFFSTMKGVRFLMPLRFMVSSMFACVPVVGWAICMVALSISFFSVFFMQVVVIGLTDEKVNPEELAGLRLYYRDFLTTALSLFMAVTGGLDWKEIEEPIGSIHWIYVVCFLVYVFFMALGIFNVLVGIFVDTAFETSNRDREHIIMSEKARTHSFMKDVVELFKEIDSDNVGQITKDQFMEVLDDPRMKSFMNSFHLNMLEPLALFKMLDKDRSNSLELAELTYGLMRLGGEARSSDLLMLFNMMTEMQEDLMAFMQSTEQKLAFQIATQRSSMPPSGNWSSVPLAFNRSSVPPQPGGDTGVGSF